MALMDQNTAWWKNSWSWRHLPEKPPRLNLWLKGQFQITNNNYNLLIVTDVPDMVRAAARIQKKHGHVCVQIVTGKPSTVM